MLLNHFKETNLFKSHRLSAHIELRKLSLDQILMMKRGIKEQTYEDTEQEETFKIKLEDIQRINDEIKSKNSFKDQVQFFFIKDEIFQFLKSLLTSNDFDLVKLGLFRFNEILYCQENDALEKFTQDCLNYDFANILIDILIGANDNQIKVINLLTSEVYRTINFDKFKF